MPKRLPLPSEFRGAPFSVANALSRGVSAGRLRSSDLVSPFHGTRLSASLAHAGGDPGASNTAEVTARERETRELAQRCAAYSTRMREGNAFSHQTAAVLWGVPLPLALALANVHVVAPRSRRAPEGRGVVGHRAALNDPHVFRLGGLPVSSAAATWCQLAEVLSVPDLVAAGEWLITGNPYARVLPMATVDELARELTLIAGGRGHPRRLRALPQLRPGPLSRPETHVRLLVVGAGIPEPEINVDVVDDGEFIAMPDLVWRDYKVALEYEGDHHREVGQYRLDIRRIERLVDHGWLVVKVSALDLYSRPDELVARVAHRLASRGWRGAVKLRHNVQLRP
ncbi:MAG: endonuclease domain-containing protein [Microbacteriaceae bacterium]